jgi:hypothetical protein
VIQRVCVVAVLAAEGLALYTLAELVATGYRDGSQHAMGAWAFIAIALVAYGLPRLLDGLGVSESRGKVVLTGAMVFVVYLVLRIEIAGDVAVWRWGWVPDFIRDPEQTLTDGRYGLFAAVFAIAMWMRGSMRSADEIELETVVRHVAPAFALVTIVVIFGAATERSGEIGRAGLAFYAVEIVALACSQLALSGVTFGQLRAGGVVATLLGGTVVVVVVMFIVASVALVFAGPVIGPPAGKLLNAVLTITLTPFAWLLEKLFHALLGDKNPFQDIAPQNLPLNGDEHKQQGNGQSGWFDFGVFLVRGLALAITAGLVLGGVWLASRLRRRNADRIAGDAQTSTAGGIGDDGLALLRSLFRRGPREAKHRGDGVARLYQEVVARGAESSRPRLVGETPAEFAPVLSEAFHAPVTDDITRAFEQARYAGREPDAATVLELERRWKSVR